MTPTELRPFQKKALQILAASNSAHVVCTAPTGSGKSLIFETLARKKGTTTLILSPLRALIRQQEARLESLGIELMPRPHPVRLGDRARAWITTPESLTSAIRRGYRPGTDTLLVIDECHCIEEWGGSFRPAFDELPALARRWRIRRSLWLSATLEPKVRARLEVNLPQPQHWVGSFGLHPSLELMRFRIPKAGRPQFLRRWLEAHPGPGLVFSFSRRECEELGRLLHGLARSMGLKVQTATYHAGLTREERLIIEERAQEGSLHWLSATSAFGMGMNYPHFGWVLLWEPPPSLPTLAQMLGRCGRSLEARPRGALLWDHPELERLDRLTPENSKKIRDFFLSADEPQVWLTEFFS
jgi:ATP-dependent DNA helicase RecQ